MVQAGSAGWPAMQAQEAAGVRPCPRRRGALSCKSVLTFQALRKKMARPRNPMVDCVYDCPVRVLKWTDTRNHL